MKRITRRYFLEKSWKSLGIMSLAAGTVPFFAPEKVWGANEQVNFALIGAGGRGPVVARGLIGLHANLAYVCELHPQRRVNVAKELGKVQGRAPKTVDDMRKVFDDKEIDAVLIATPDHWHAPASILACQAGKDVYVEKPHAKTIWESRKMIQAARKYKRIMQVGTQNRSAPYDLAALEYVRSGKLGPIHLVKVYNLKPGNPYHLGEPGTKPPGFDWDYWLGPASERPYHQGLFHHGWLRFWDFSGGDIAGDGIHQLDLAMMLMGDPGTPKAVSSSGGHIAFPDDDSEVPDLLVVAYDFDGFVMTLEHSDYPRYMRKTTGTIRRNDVFPYWTQNATRIELYGTDRMMTVGRHGGGWIVTISGGKIVDKMYGRPPDTFHQQNFLDCIKSRKRPNADIETLHPSYSMVSMANIAYRVGNLKLFYDGKNEKFIDNPTANQLLTRKYRPQYAVPNVV